MSKNDDRIIRFSGLKPGVYEYGVRVGDDFFAEFKNEEIVSGKVDFGVKMVKKERMLLFSFSFEGEVATRCDRCLGPMSVKVEGEEQLTVEFGEAALVEAERVVLPESASEIDLSPWLYEYVAVRIPLQHMHSDEEECDPEVTRFISDEPQARDEDYVDPRWEALKELK